MFFVFEIYFRFFSHVYLCIVCMMLVVPLCGEARRGLASLELDLEIHGFWDSYPDFYKKQHVLLSTESCLQPQKCEFYV